MANIEISVNENGTKTLATAGKYCDRNIDVNVSVPVPDGYIKPSGSVKITENGTFDVTDKAEAVVNVPSGGSDELAISILDRSITELSSNSLAALGAYALTTCKKLTKVTLPNCGSVGASAFQSCNTLTDVYIRSDNGTSFGANTFYQCAALEKIDLLFKTASAGTLYGAMFRSCPQLSMVVIRNDYVVSLANTNAFLDSGVADGAGFVYVPDELVDNYKAATNWIAYADQIKGISELEETA